MMNPDNLQSLDEARSPDSCTNCQLMNMCTINAARIEFVSSRAIQSMENARKLRTGDELAKHCGYYARDVLRDRVAALEKALESEHSHNQRLQTFVSALTADMSAGESNKRYEGADNMSLDRHPLLEIG